MVVALGAGDPPQLGQAGWDPALPWEGNSSQWECELGKREHLLQHHQAPVHQQRPGQSFGSLVADLIFCQAAQKKKIGCFSRGKGDFHRPWCVPGHSWDGEQRRATETIWFMVQSDGFSPGVDTRQRLQRHHFWT